MTPDQKITEECSLTLIQPVIFINQLLKLLNKRIGAKVQNYKVAGKKKHIPVKYKYLKIGQNLNKQAQFLSMTAYT